MIEEFATANHMSVAEIAAMVEKQSVKKTALQTRGALTTGRVGRDRWPG